MLDAYAVLGVPEDASAAQLKAAHRRLVRRHHPDLAAPEERAAATERVQRINVAYGLVRDPAARAAYDEVRAAAHRRAPGQTVAARYDRLVGDAGLWAGRWWQRRRRRSARIAARTARRAGQRTGRTLWHTIRTLQWAGLTLVGGLLGAAIALLAAQALGRELGFTLLVGVAGGAMLGWQHGRARARPDTAAGAALPLTILAAYLAALMLDARLFPGG